MSRADYSYVNGMSRTPEAFDSSIFKRAQSFACTFAINADLVKEERSAIDC